MWQQKILTWIFRNLNYLPYLNVFRNSANLTTFYLVNEYPVYDLLLWIFFDSHTIFLYDCESNLSISPHLWRYCCHLYAVSFLHSTLKVEGRFVDLMSFIISSNMESHFTKICNGYVLEIFIHFSEKYYYEFLEMSITLNIFFRMSM